MSALGSLVVKLALEYAQYTGGLDKSEQQALSFAKNVQDSFDKASKAGREFLGGVVSGAVAAVGAYASLSTVIGGVRAAIDRLDALDDISQRTGVAKKDLQELGYAGHFADVSMESLAGAAQKLSLQMAEAAAGGKEQQAVFKALGIEVTESNGKLRSVTAVMGDLADRFAMMEDGAEKTAAAQKVLGKSGAEMITLLNGGRVALDDMASEAHRFGLVLEDEVIGAAGEFNDNLDRMGFIVDGTFNALASGALPVLNEFTGAMVDAMTKAGDFGRELSAVGGVVGSAIRTVGEAVTVLGANVAYVFQAAGREIGAIAAQFVALATLDIDGFWVIRDAVKADADAARAELDDFERRVLGLVSSLPSLAGGGRGIAPDPRSLGDPGTIQDQARAAASAEFTRRLKEQREAEENARAATQASTKAHQELQRELQAQQRVLDALNGVTGDFSESWDRLNGMYREGKITLDQLYKAQDALWSQQPKAKAMAEAAKEELDARAKIAEIAARELDAAGVSAAEIAASNEALRQEIELIGLEGYARAGRLRMREEEAIAALEERKYMLQLQEGTQALVQEIEREIRLRRERIALMGQKTDAEYTQGVWQRQREEADQFNQQFGQAFTNALMQGGKSGWEYVKGLFRTGIGLNVSTSVSGGVQAFTQETSRGGGIINGLSSAYSAVSGGMASSIGGAISSVGSMFGSSTLGAFGAGMQGATLGAGMMGPTTAGATGAMGAGAAFAQAIPYIGAIVALASILGNRNKWSKGFGEAAVLDGVAVAGQTSTFGDLTAAGQRSTFSNAKYSEGLANSTQTLAQGIADLVKSYGGGGAFSVAQAASTASKKDQAESNTAVFVNGQYYETGSEKSKKADQAQVIADQALRATVKVMQETVTGRFGDYFDSLDAMEAEIPELQRLMETAAAMRQVGMVMDQLGPTFRRLNDLAVGTMADLAAQFGGADAFGAAVQSAFSVLYTEEEKLQILTGNVTAEFVRLGTAMPENAAGFRAVLEGLDLTTEAGRQTYAALIAVAPAWAEVQASVQSAAETVSQTMQRLVTDERQAQVELLRAQGRTAEARALQRSIETEGMTELEVAAYDRIQALRDETSATLEATAAAEELAQAAIQTARGLSEQTSAARVALLQAQGRAAEAAALQRDIDTAGMSDAARAVYDLNRSMAAQTEYLTASSQAAEQASRDAQAAYEAAAQAQRTAALEALEQQRQAAQAAVSAAQSEVSRLDAVGKQLGDAVRSLYGEVASTITMQSDDGRRLIARALATAVIPDTDRLAQAISAVRAGQSSTQYASQFDADRDRLVLAGQLSQLEALNAGRKTVAEQQLDVARSSLTELERIRSALNAPASQQAPTPAPEPVARPDLSGITATAAYLSANPDVAAAYQQNTYGMTIDEYVRTHYQRYGRAENRLSPEEELRRLGIPSLSVGTNFVPADMLAYLHKGEAVVPRQYNPAAGGREDLMGSFGEALRAELVALRGLVRDGNEKLGRMVTQFNNVTEGGNAMRVEIMEAAA